MKSLRHHHRKGVGKARAALCTVLFSFAAALFAVAAAEAFQSVRVENVTAGCLTGGVRPQFLKISHTPLSEGSEVTREVIILGEAGFDTPTTPPPYNQRMTVFSPAPAPENQQIEVLVEYRFIPSLSAGPEESVFTPAIVGPDPVAFAFEINPSSVTSGALQYRILARRLNSNTTSYTYSPREIAGVPQWNFIQVKSNALQVIGIQGGRFSLVDGNPADGETFLDVPRGLFSTPTAVTLDEIPLNDPSIPQGLPEAIKVYRVDSQGPVKGNMMLTALYPDFEYPQGQDGIIDGSQRPETSIGMAYWDGFTWRYLGGVINATLNTVTARIGGSGFYAIVPAQAQAAQDARPFEKIITPNGDGKNDIATFLFANPLDNTKIEIFDMTGHRIRTLFSATDNGWDGRDENGSVVESGVYIYQFKTDGKLVSGLVAVAK